MGYRYSLTGDERLIGLLQDCLLEVLLREGFARSLEIDGMGGPQILQFSRGDARVTVEVEREADGIQARLTVEADLLDPRPFLRHAGMDLLELCVVRAVAPTLGLPPGELLDRLRKMVGDLMP
jgi:hypothetical protein